MFGTRAGDVLQVIDVDKRTLNNVITFPPDGVFFVRSDIEIASPQRVNFRYFFFLLHLPEFQIVDMFVCFVDMFVCLFPRKMFPGKNVINLNP